MLKKCPRCGRVLPEKEFAPKTNHCKLCRRDYDWQYRYGLSPEQYYEIYVKQDGKCAICGKELPDGEYLHVDHNKETGEIRGLLCSSCNKGIGLLKDNPQIMEKAIEYVQKKVKNNAGYKYVRGNRMLNKRNLL